MFIMKIPFNEILGLYSSTVKISVEEECHIRNSFQSSWDMYSLH